MVTTILVSGYRKSLEQRQEEGAITNIPSSLSKAPGKTQVRLRKLLCSLSGLLFVFSSVFCLFGGGVFWATPHYGILAPRPEIKPNAPCIGGTESKRLDHQAVDSERLNFATAAILPSALFLSFFA